MHTPTTSTLITALAGAALALANPAPAPAPSPPSLPRRSSTPTSPKSHSGHQLPKSIACARKVVSLADTLPRETNRALARWMATAVPGAVTAVAGINGLDDIVPALTSQCSVYTVTSTLVPPATLTSAYSSYMSVAREWLSSAGPVAHSLASSCGPGEASAMLELMVVSDAESCTSAVIGLVNALGKGAGATTTEGSESATATASGSESETGSSTAAETGTTTRGTGTGASAPTGTTGTAGSSTNTGAATGAGMRESGRAGVVVAAAVAAAGVVALL
ncbi:hypothetical protein C8A05DRAFT_34545 [Staphylotrichum tortipilum]|uniref:Infection structure specific protein n=1 Tax=Staphylotrichum tortipilum TaxID=2831512 RepID=A0AAN6MJK1_9PEZI|nr:hypothetical protein C8A05DRAFT_34545 [Staphylotrichum longicolle]